LVSVGPNETFPNVRVSLNTVRILKIFAGEIPGHSGADNSEVIASHDECTDPHQSKEHTGNHPVCTFTSVDFLLLVLNAGD
jgi:hypothetical protein